MYQDDTAPLSGDITVVSTMPEQESGTQSDASSEPDATITLKRPLNKMHLKDLRDLAMHHLPQITNASTADEATLRHRICEVLGIKEEDHLPLPNANHDEISTSKHKIDALKSSQAHAEDKAEQKKLRKQLSKLKKKTRRLSKAG